MEQTKPQMMPTGAPQINAAIRGIVMPELSAMRQEIRDLRAVVDAMAKQILAKTTEKQKVK
jgi:hypothetical protein